MFGTLKPSHAGLGCVAHRDWQRFYCGTCQSLGVQFGLAYRALLSHDAVFLGLLVDALQADAAKPDRTRCPMLPILHRPTVNPDSVGMRYAGAVQMLLAEQWAADRAIDGRRAAAVGRQVLAGPASSARASLAELGCDLGDLIGFETRQAAIEVHGRTSPAAAAEPTAAALELVFRQIAVLPGSAIAAELADTLARLGRGLGTAIYLIDALEDLERDLLNGDFNPCTRVDARGRAALDHSRVGEAITLLADARTQIATVLASLPLRRHAAVLSNIVVTSLGARAEQAIVMAQALCQREHARRSALARWADRSGVVRFAQVMAAVLLTFVTGAWSRVVRAATTTETGGTETGGNETGGALASEQPPDIPTAPDLPHDGEVVTPSGGSNPCGGCLDDICGSLCGGLRDACSGCGPDVCQGCIEPCTGFCSGCRQDCGNACSGCQQCGDACSSCGSSCQQCGDVCSSCGDCGNACSGCGDCGNACSGCSNCGSGCNNCGGGC